LSLARCIEERRHTDLHGRHGRWLDQVLIERLWRLLRYESVSLKRYADGRKACVGIALGGDVVEVGSFGWFDSAPADSLSRP
jgi:hypothetical protein